MIIRIICYFFKSVTQKKKVVGDLVALCTFRKDSLRSVGVSSFRVEKAIATDRPGLSGIV